MSTLTLSGRHVDQELRHVKTVCAERQTEPSDPTAQLHHDWMHTTVQDGFIGIIWAMKTMVIEACRLLQDARTTSVKLHSQVDSITDPLGRLVSIAIDDGMPPAIKTAAQRAMFSLPANLFPNLAPPYPRAPLKKPLGGARPFVLWAAAASTMRS